MSDSAAEEEPQEDQYQVTVFEAVGGQRFFDLLAEHFYEVVATDDVLLPLYPEPDDLGPAAERLALFLGQYWGGPATYSERRGHPRLRLRHVPYVIGDAERDHWLAAMLDALERTLPQTPLEAELAELVGERMTEYFTLSAQHLINSDR